jgi:hypothetical protein
VEILLLLGAAGLLTYAISQGQAQAQAVVQSALTVGQTAYLNAATQFLLSGGQSVTLPAWTRVYVQTADASGQTQIRTDSGNVGTVPTSSITAILPAGVTMQVN